MKEYKSKDFIKLPPQDDTLLWTSRDKQFTITTTTNQYSQYFVYVSLLTGDEWIGIQENDFEDTIDSLNQMIISGEINQYLV